MSSPPRQHSPMIPTTTAPSGKTVATDFGSPPIGFFYRHLHDALRRELETLWETALVLESCGQAALRSQLVCVEERCVFLQKIYKYHSVAEDEVVYPALDSKVKNVTLQYSVEHADEEHLFVLLLQMLREAIAFSGPQHANVVRDLVCKVEEVRFTLTRHLAKEEKQLFPLLQQHFSYVEQADLIAQFLCCIPLEAVEGILVWLKPGIPQEEQDQLIHFIQEAIPDDMLLNLLVAWLNPTSESATRPRIKAYLDPEMLNHPPLDLIIHVHRSLAAALNHFVSEARSLGHEDVNSAKLASLVEKHRFLRAVCRFHMLSEEEVMFPELSRQSAHNQCQFATCQADHLEETVWFEDLGRLLTDVKSSARRGAKEVSELLNKVILCAELVSENLGEHMEREERDVFPFLRESLSTIEQCIVVWRTLTIMPLRLLQRVLPWLACGLTSQKVTEFLAVLNIGSSARDAVAVELLSRWLHNEEPADTSCDNPSGAACFQPNFVEAEATEIIAPSVRKRRKVSERKSIPVSSSDDDASYSHSDSGGICGPQPTLAKPCVGPSPIDHIFQFHKALMRDFRLFEAAAGELVQLLERGETKWEKTIQNLTGQFQFLRGIYIAHSSTEDNVVFPALESKDALKNISHSYMLDHKEEGELFDDMEKAISQFRTTQDPKELKVFVLQFCRKCAAVRAAIETHVRAEETELWPLFAEHFCVEEQHRLVGAIVGRTGAKVMQTMLPWVSSSITSEEGDNMMDSLRTASRNTRFDKWLDAIGEPDHQEENNPQVESGQSSISCAQPSMEAPLEEVAQYLRSRGLQAPSSPEQSGTVAETSHFRPGWEEIFRMNQKQLEAAVRCVSSDDSLEPSRKSYITQWIMVSKYIVTQQRLASACDNRSIAKASQDTNRNDGLEEASTIYCTYHSQEDGVLGCQHYKRKCALVAPCCSKVFTCRLCHDDQCDHKMERNLVTEMVCMICGKKQPVSATCAECKESMARYFCSICRLFDDDPNHKIYHCQFCNVCRRGEGLGIDFFHCMECNACMHMSLYNQHTCREKSIECNCPICNEGLFDSCQPIKELPCGHFMHSGCFSSYSQYNYSCPICSKSIGDMSAYFQMLDLLLESQPMPPEVQNMKQRVYCNDCCEETDVMYHYVYHPCGKCHSYNTRVI